MPPALNLSDVEYAWGGASSFQLRLPAFEMAAGEMALLLGASGSGKSTLLSLVCGIIAPDRGRVEIGGVDLGALSRRRRDRLRAEQIGVVFQQFNLLPYATPLDNILLPLRFAPARRKRLHDARAEALRLSGALGLEASLIETGRAGALSVGQQQRVAVARALIGAPSLIVADEPTSALDAGAQAAFLDLLFEQARAAGSTLLMVSHDDRLAARFDRAVALDDIARVTRAGAAA